MICSFYIEIKELDIFDNKKIVLAITIHLKLDGYAPKQTLEYLKNIRISDNEKKTSKSQNETCLSNGGGEVKTSLNILITQTLQNTRFGLIVIYVPKYISYTATLMVL